MNGLLFLIFVAADIVMAIYGVWLFCFGFHFRKSAYEGVAAINKREIMERTAENRKHGNLDMTTLYCLRLLLNGVRGLPSEAFIWVNKSEYVKALEGDLVTIYYLPDDTTHIALSRTRWLSDSIVMLIAAFVYALVLGAVLLIMFI